MHNRKSPDLWHSGHFGYVAGHHGDVWQKWHKKACPSLSMLIRMGQGHMKAATSSAKTVQLRWIEAFLAVADGANQSDAAKKMGLSQSTMSRRIDSLAEWMNCSLFEDKGCLQLTTAGELFALTARRVVLLLAQYRVDVSPDNSSMSLAWLQAFLEVVKTRNFTTAGSNLGWSQSTVSRYIRALSKWAGRKILNSFVDPSPTTEGELLVLIAQEIIQIMNASRTIKNPLPKPMTQAKFEQGTKQRFYKLYITLDGMVDKYGPMIPECQKNFELLETFFYDSDHAHKKRREKQKRHEKKMRAIETGRAIDMDALFEELSSTHRIKDQNDINKK